MEQAYSPVEIIVVDNGSRDDSVAFVQREYPAVIVINLPKNIGYAAGMNKGIAAAHGEFIATLNNDTRVDSDWVQQLVGILETDSTIGSCASKQLNFYNQDVIDSTGILLYRGGYPRNRGAGQKDAGQFAVVDEVFAAPGASAIYRRSMLEQIGLFDRDYFAYQEEWDLSFRGQWFGWKCVYVPSAVVYHMGGATMAKRNHRAHIFLMERNRIFTIVKNYSLSMYAATWMYLVKYEIDVWKRIVFSLELAPLFARIAAAVYVPVMAVRGFFMRKRARVTGSTLIKWFVR
jgi:GT2 family glycosyltransferase